MDIRRRSISVFLITLTLLNFGLSQHSKEEWKSRTIYQVLTDRFWRSDDSTKPCDNIGQYCGGTYKGLIKQLDYIKGMGFDAIWISPVIKNTPGGYHGYWAKDKYDVNENFGTAQDLKDLKTELSKRDMWLMVDVVANHMGYVGGSGFDFTELNPFNKTEYFHKWCEVNAEDYLKDQWRVEHCRLAGLPDLDQDNKEVRGMLIDWIKYLVKEYTIDGIRIDTIPFVSKDFWSEFTTAAGVYSVGECFDERTDYVAGYQGPVNAMLNYPLFFALNDFFRFDQNGGILRQKIAEINEKFTDVDALGVFIDNHDNQRFLYGRNNINRLRNAIAFTLFTRGIPIIYYGTEQDFNGGNDPNNREPLWTSLNPENSTYKFITKLIDLRKKMKVWTLDQTERYVDTNHYVFSRGNIVVVNTNTDYHHRVKLTYLPYYIGQVVCDQVADQGECYTVGSDGIDVIMASGDVVVLAPKE